MNEDLDLEDLFAAADAIGSESSESEPEAEPVDYDPQAMRAGIEELQDWVASFFPNDDTLPGAEE